MAMTGNHFPNHRLQAAAADSHNPDDLQMGQVIPITGSLSRREFLRLVSLVNVGSLLIVISSGCKDLQQIGVTQRTATPAASLPFPTDTPRPQDTATITPSATSSPTASSTPSPSPTPRMVDLARQATPKAVSSPWGVFAPQTQSPIMYMIPCSSSYCVVARYESRLWKVIKVVGEYTDRDAKRWYFVDGLLDVSCWVDGLDLQLFDTEIYAQAFAANGAMQSTVQAKTATAEALIKGRTATAAALSQERTATAIALATIRAATATAYRKTLDVINTAESRRKTLCPCEAYKPEPTKNNGVDSGPCPAGHPIPGPNQRCGCDNVGNCICDCVRV